MNEQSKVRSLLMLHENACVISFQVLDEMANEKGRFGIERPVRAFDNRRQIEDETINLMCRIMEMS